MWKLLRSFTFSLLVTLLAPTTELFGQWVQQPFPFSGYLWEVRFADSSTGWIVGTNYLYKTEDGGATWIAQDTAYAFYDALYALNASVAFHASSRGIPGMRRTTNGGTAWQIVDSLHFYYTEIEFITSQVGYAAGGTLPDLHGAIRKTTDGGSTWFTRATGISDWEIQGISFINEMEGWAVSYRGAMFHTTDGGREWEFQDTVGQPAGFHAPLPISDVQFTTPDSGWAVGGISGTLTIARTTDGGTHWSTFSEPGGSLQEVVFLNNQLGWAIGFNSFPLRTTNSGQSWERQYPDPLTFQFESISMFDENLGWAVGGGVYRTTNAGVVSEAETKPQVPQQFVLAQNYPNPFNPNTTIRYELPDRALVTLKVYNLLGQEVATLVNEEKEAGSYQVQFDGTGFASGLYFYRLKAGGFVETRKLVLLR